MPKLAAFVGEFSRLSELFTVIGVHEPLDSGNTVDAVRAAATALATRAQRPPSLLDLIIVDKSPGMFAAYSPEGLGDMVLLDPTGRVAAIGRTSLDVLRSTLATTLRDLEGNVEQLQAAKKESDVKQAVGALIAMGLTAGDTAIADFAGACPTRLVAGLYESVFAHNRLDVILGEAGLGSGDAKYRKAALAFIEEHPDPRFAEGIVAALKQPKLKTGTICDLLELATACDAKSARVLGSVVEHSSHKSTRVRAEAVKLLAVLGSPEAEERLLAVLTEDKAATVRRAAARALAVVGSARGREAVEMAAKQDRSKLVRTAAEQILAKWKP